MFLTAKPCENWPTKYDSQKSETLYVFKKLVKFPKNKGTWSNQITIGKQPKLSRIYFQKVTTFQTRNSFYNVWDKTRQRYKDICVQTVNETLEGDLDQYEESLVQFIGLTILDQTAQMNECSKMVENIKA